MFGGGTKMLKAPKMGMSKLFGRRNKAEATEEAEEESVGGPLPDFDPPAWLGVLPDPLAVDTDDYAESLGLPHRAGDAAELQAAWQQLWQPGPAPSPERTRDA